MGASLVFVHFDYAQTHFIHIAAFAGCQKTLDAGIIIIIINCMVMVHEIVCAMCLLNAYKYNFAVCICIMPIVYNKLLFLCQINSELYSYFGKLCWHLADENKFINKKKKRNEHPIHPRCDCINKYYRLTNGFIIKNIQTNAHYIDIMPSQYRIHCFR